MADSAPPGTNLPPPPPAQGPPGYDGQQGNPQQHMPPPALAPVIIPQNTNPIPTAISSPISGGVMSPTSAGGSAYTPRRAAPEPNKRALYVGGLDPRVTEDVLRQIFETTGHVQSVKIIPDKTSSAPSVSRCASELCHPTPPMLSSQPSAWYRGETDAQDTGLQLRLRRVR